MLLLCEKKVQKRTLVRRAYTVRWIDNLLQEELHQIETRFTEICGCSKKLFKQTFDSFKSSNKKPNSNVDSKNNKDTDMTKPAI